MLHAIPINSPDITSAIWNARLSLYTLEQVAHNITDPARTSPTLVAGQPRRPCVSRGFTPVPVTDAFSFPLHDWSV